MFCKAAINAFNSDTEKSFDKLPCLEVALTFEGINDHKYYGCHQALGEDGAAYGIKLECRPRDDLKDEIEKLLADEDSAFPFEYYSISFSTFSGQTITPYQKLLAHITVDNTKISSEYASRAYVGDFFKSNAETKLQNHLQMKYREAKEKFSKTHLEELNKSLGQRTKLSVKSNSKANLETDLTILHDEIDIDNLGMGMQCFIRTSFALSKKSNIDVVLLEEPENHLSHLNMKRLIEQIAQVSKSQVFVATHSSYICSRLDLRKAILFGEPTLPTVRLSDLPEDTAKFFMKAPQNSLLEFIQSKRSILVEGDAEYMLMKPLYKTVLDADAETSMVSIISVGGITFRRYLDIARLSGNKVAVITDNDGDPTSNRIESYKEYETPDKIAIFVDPDKERRTFEICMYRDNKDICEARFETDRKTLSVEAYMLGNKSETAFQLALNDADKLVSPDYIKDAVKWISA